MKARSLLLIVLLLSIVAVVVPQTSQKVQYAHAAVFSLASFNELGALMQQGKPIILEIWNPSCPHCQRMVAPVEQFSVNYPDIIFANMDIENPAVFPILQGIPTPTFALIENGHIVDHTSGESQQGLMTLVNEASGGSASGSSTDNSGSSTDNSGSSTDNSGSSSSSSCPSSLMAQFNMHPVDFPVEPGPPPGYNNCNGPMQNQGPVQ
jgi:thiol-disulfide isomerase/thioredoxin